jgi:hypothetical protein
MELREGAAVLLEAAGGVAGEEESSRATCSGLDRKLIMEVCFWGLEMGVLLFL